MYAHAAAFYQEFELVAGHDLVAVGGVESFATASFSDHRSITEEIALDVVFAIFCNADQGSFAHGVVFHGVVDGFVVACEAVEFRDDVAQDTDLAGYISGVVAPFGDLFGGTGFKHFNGSIVAAGAQAGIQGHHVDLVGIRFTIPAHLSGLA